MELPDALRPPLSATVAQLLESRVPARLAWTAAGDPRVAPIWFHWTGSEIVMAGRPGAAKLAHVRTGTALALTIDTDEFPYRSLAVRGVATVEPTDGVAAEYALAAERYLGPTLASRWLEFVGGDQVRIALRPTHATWSDLSESGFFAR